MTLKDCSGIAVAFGVAVLLSVPFAPVAQAKGGSPVHHAAHTAKSQPNGGTPTQPGRK
jgi:hypothetical protein